VADRLPLPDGDVATAFQRIVDVLRRDADLARVVRTWRVMEGTTNDDDPPSIAQAPWVRLGFEPEAGQLVANPGPRKTTLTPILIDIETYISGTRAADSANLYDAMRTALFPVDEEVRSLMTEANKAAGISGEPLIVRPWWTGKAGREGGGEGGALALWARGQLRLLVYTFT
jgi:hypothetical protein